MVVTGVFDMNYPATNWRKGSILLENGLLKVIGNIRSYYFVGSERKGAVGFAGC